jgi:general L-amino acid transport system permease protein
MKAIAWARVNLFNGVWNTILTLVAGYLIARGAWMAIDWGLIHAAWSAPDGRACRAITNDEGACWAFIEQWYRFILFGRFPPGEQWRALIVVILFIGMVVVSCDRRLWRSAWPITAIWVVGLIVSFILMHGGVLGLPVVTTDLWNGLPLTLFLSVIALAGAFPLAILLALGRRSDYPIIRALSVGYIELVRGVPIISILFMASVMLPLFLPAGVNIDNLIRALVGLMLFYAAALAEVIRGGLQAIPTGQYEAADVLGLSFSQKTRLVVLQQALSITIPPLVNTFISAFKDTTLVTIVGLFDLLTTASNSITDPQWRGFYVEAYVFVAAIYFVFCFSMSRYSRSLERSTER